MSHNAPPKEKSVANIPKTAAKEAISYRETEKSHVHAHAQIGIAQRLCKGHLSPRLT